MRVHYFFLIVILFSSALGAEGERYVCPMHPHIVGEAGATCPICGMALVAQPSADTETKGSIKITPHYMQSLGVKTAPVVKQHFGKLVRAYGRVLPNQRLSYELTVREEAWVQRLIQDAEGDIVKRGDLLLELYSPAMMGAQSDYLIAKKEGRLGRFSEQQLRLVGMDDKAITQFKQQDRMLENIPVHAPRNGVITALHVSEGGYLEKGARVMTLQDFSQLWVDASVAQRELQFIAPGSTAVLTLPDTGESYTARVDHIHPMNDAETLTATVRLHVDNKNGTLRPETYAEVIFESAAEPRIAVPEEAVLYDGRGAYVFEAIGDGVFRPLPVSVGISSHGLTEIMQGVEEGQQVVVSGQFLIDAESRLQGAMTAMDGSGEDGDSHSSMQPEALHHGH